MSLLRFTLPTAILSIGLAAQAAPPEKKAPAAAEAEAGPAASAPLPPLSVDWRLAGGGAALLVGAGVLIKRRRGRRDLVVELVLDDLHEGRFAVALFPEKADSMVGEVQLRLGQETPTVLESGLTALPAPLRSRFSSVADGVRMTTTFAVRGEDRLRVLCFGRTAARGDVSLQVGGALSVSSPAAVRVHAQERLVQVLDTDLTVTFDLRLSKSPLRGSRPPVPQASAPTAGSSPASLESAPRPASRTSLPPVPQPSSPLPRVGAVGAPALASSPSAPSAPAVAPAVLPPTDADLAKRARAYFLEGKYEESAVVYGQLKDLENQARCFLFLGQTEKVAQIDATLAYQRRDFESAVNHYLRAKDAVNAARVLRELGRSKEAYRVEADAKAAAGRPVEAAADYLRAGELSKAAEMYLQMGNTVRAAELFVQGESFAEAARLYAGQGDLPRAAELFQRAALPAEAALVLYKMGHRDEAMALAERVAPTDPKALAAANVLARAYAELGRTVDLQALALRIADPAAEPGDPELLYALGTFFEAKGLLAEAVGTLQRIGAGEGGFKDVPARLTRLESTIRGRSPSGSAVSFSRPMAPSGGETSADLRGASETSVDLAPITGPLKPVARGLPQGTQRYRIDAELGRGAMGIVYRGTDTLLGRPVAVKTLPHSLATDPRLSRMFLDEARSLAALNHPHIVQIFDMGEMDGTLFLAMEFVTGETLETVLEREGKLAVKRALTLVDQVAQALESAHGHGVVHRDIKPANVMLAGNGQIKLMDFGIAAAGESAQQVGDRLGTPFYMSPEQAMGKPVDGRSDLYALGVVLYRLLCGSVPFETGDILIAHINAPVPPLAARAPETPAGVVALVEAMLAKEPAERPPTAADLRARLTPLLAAS